jgi:hypothetical protein
MTSESETDSDDDEIIYDDDFKRRTRLSTQTANNGMAASPKKNGVAKLPRETPA